LTVLEFAGRYKSKYTMWKCQCSCENKTIVIVNGSHLVKGSTQSCGCLQKERCSNATKKHLMSNSKEYVSWYNMVSRCTKEDHKYYHYYGGRGIMICDEWLDDFEQFYKDMGQMPEGKYSIERIDNNGNYCKENCKWIHLSEQNRNNRNVKLKLDDAIEIRKSFKKGSSAISLSKQFNVSVSTIYDILLFRSWIIYD
jgi:hypothetical protein